MSGTVGLAAVAAVAAAAGLAELVVARAESPRSRGGRSRRVARLLRALVQMGRRIGAPAPPRDLAARIAAAGSPLGLGATEVASVKAAGGALALVAGGPVALSLPGRLPFVALPALPLAGYLAPDLALARIARARGRAMEEELPDLLDLLRVSVDAGLAVSRALDEVGRRHRGRLAREWRAAAGQIELGVPRERALRAMAARCPAPAVGALVFALERAERHGAPLSETLFAQAHEARAARARRVRERAARAAPKIQLVVALLLVPSVLLMVAAALLASLAR
jgi:tight adherence protein C